MVHKFNQYNESLRDKMTSVSEDDIRNKMGEEKYHVYKTLNDAKNNIKPPFKTSELLIDENNKYPIRFEINIRFLTFYISYNGNNWIFSYYFQKPSETNEYYDTWDEVFNRIVKVTNNSYNKDISDRQKNVDLLQTSIDSMENELKKINK